VIVNINYARLVENYFIAQRVVSRKQTRGKALTVAASECHGDLAGTFSYSLTLTRDLLERESELTSGSGKEKIGRAV